MRPYRKGGSTASGAADMRKAIDGIMVLVQDVLQADPFSSHVFVFCNRVRDREIFYIPFCVRNC